MSNIEKRNIFISYSRFDKELVDQLKSIIEKFIEACGFKDSLGVKEMGDMPGANEEHNGWREKIFSEISSCYALIALYTVNSSESNWVHYEIGYAQGLKKNIQVLCAEGVEIDKSIMRETQLIDLSTKIKGGQISSEAVRRLLSSVFNNSEFGNFFIQKFIDDFVNECAVEIGNFIYSCNTKHVYIVGSEPLTDPDSPSIWRDENGRKVNDFVEQIVDNLSEKNSSFVFSSFPSVPHVGSVVMSYLVEKSNKDNAFEIAHHYSIAGLYQMDADTISTLDDNKINKTIWDGLLLESRKNYLRDKDCMIIIGGSTNTEAEYEASRKIKHLQVFPIPCFGGFGRKCYKEMSNDSKFEEYDHPCRGCEATELNRSCPFLKKLDSRLKVYKTPLDKK